MANDIRDILNGLSKDDRAIYAEVRTTMRRAYLYAHSRTLPIEDYSEADDAFLDLVDIKIAELFDRSGRFDAGAGHIDVEKAKQLEAELKQKELVKQFQEQAKNQAAVKPNLTEAVNTAANISAASKMIANDAWSTKPL